GGRKSGNAEHDVVLEQDILDQPELTAARVPGSHGQIQIASAGDLIGEHGATSQPELSEDATVQTLKEDVVRVPLDGQRAIAEKAEILHPARILEIDQDTNPFAFLRIEDRAQQPAQ